MRSSLRNGIYYKYKFLDKCIQTDISAEQKLCQLPVFCTGEEGPKKNDSSMHEVGFVCNVSHVYMYKCILYSSATSASNSCHDQNVSLKLMIIFSFTLIYDLILVILNGEICTECFKNFVN